MLQNEIEEEDPLVADQESLMQPSKVADNYQAKIRTRITSSKSLRSRQESLRSYKSSVVSEGSEITTTQTLQMERDVTYSEIMKHYSPKWMAVVGFIASIFASFQLPMFGFVLS